MSYSFKSYDQEQEPFVKAPALRYKRVMWGGTDQHNIKTLWIYWGRDPQAMNYRGIFEIWWRRPCWAWSPISHFIMSGIDSGTWTGRFRRFKWRLCGGFELRTPCGRVIKGAIDRRNL